LNFNDSQLLDMPISLSDAEREILEISEAWSQAIVSNDADRIGKYMADNWIMVSEHGVSTREHFLGLVGSGQLTHSSMDLAELSRVTVYGDMAVFVGRVTNTAHFGGETFDADEWTSDIFRKTSNGWKCVMSHITPAKVGSS
jgi:ketosteroid isomerase-like protein